MGIALKRIYEPVAADDGYRVLVDRLWPRGISKTAAQLDEWAKDIAPSTELRKWFHADRSRWSEFRTRYLEELKGQQEQLSLIAQRAAKEQVTLLTSAGDPVHSHASILKEQLEKMPTKQ